SGRWPRAWAGMFQPTSARAESCSSASLCNGLGGRNMPTGALSSRQSCPRPRATSRSRRGGTRRLCAVASRLVHCVRREQRQGKRRRRAPKRERSARAAMRLCKDASVLVVVFFHVLLTLLAFVPLACFVVALRLVLDAAGGRDLHLA